jgi:DNA-binding CsgD family transcriptional regulator
MDAIVRAPAPGRLSNGYSIAHGAGRRAAHHEALGRRRVLDQTRRMQWPLVGREAELGSVAEALSDGSAGGVVITGPAGVGKTRLALEVSRLAAARGCAVAWARATRSAASIPLGAFAPLLPPAEVRLPGGVELLARARHALAERAAGRRLVLCVDDGHLLDDASAALVHQLVAAGETFATVTVRPDEPAPDALRALWKDELCAVLELRELPRDEVAGLLASGLGGPVDGRSVNAIWELTRGNALFLRELVRHGVDRGLLAEDGGVWRWRGKVEAGTRLAELVDLRIDGVGPDARGVLELVAVGGPLELGLIAPATPAALESLERGELVERGTDGRRRFVGLAHPLHGEAVRARLTPTRLEAIHAQLADAVEARGARRGGDLLRLATWRLESGAPDDGALFVRAAARALAAPDPALAERLARAAVRAGAGFDAELALGRALAASGRGLDADDVLAGLGGRARDDRERAAVAMARARNLFWALDRADDADAALQGAERGVSDDGLRHELTAQRVRLTAARGRPQAALDAAGPLLRDSAVHDRARTTAALGAAEALFTSGKTEEAAALAEAWLPVARRHRDELPHAEPVLLGMRAVALRLAGRLVEATTVSEHAYEALLARRSAAATAVEANMLGLIWLARGRVRTALRFCRESAALLRDGDAAGMLAFALAGVGQAAAQAGEPDAARAAISEMERTPLGHKGFAVELVLARAWSAAASGELSRALGLARDAAALARSRGQQAYAVRALHDLCRLGDPAAAAPELAGLADRVDGPFAATAAAHAAALVAGDGAALLATAERFADQGALLVAAEAAGAAAAAHRGTGRRASARAATARAGLWLTSCEGARPPTMFAAPEATGLTPREREIALLAAAGSSSREIADRLVVSVRTVDNHLQNAYRKLGVTRRQDLSGVLTRAPE